MQENNKVSLAANAACPCEPSSQWAACCGRFIERGELPELPEQVMRSRYSAYVTGNIPYIQQTMAGPALKNFDAKDVQLWIDQVQWHHLNVIKASPLSKDNTCGYVEYCVSYKQLGKKQLLHELSEFKRIDSKWVYWSGKFLEAKRNEPCPCGSGLKYKKCCQLPST